MKPVIGILANFSMDDSVGTSTGLGPPHQHWQLLADDYVRAVEAAGGAPVILPVMENAEALFDFAASLDGILFTGGSDIDPALYGEAPIAQLHAVQPLRDRFERSLGHFLLEKTNLPLFGICRGMQMLNVLRGGTLYQDLAAQRPQGAAHTLLVYPKWHPSHEAEVRPGTWFHKTLGTSSIAMNSFNHQAVKELGKGFRAAVVAEDGLVEGMELEGERLVAAVQWHPEMMLGGAHYPAPLLEGFVTACERYQQSRGQ